MKYVGINIIHNFVRGIEINFQPSTTHNYNWRVLCGDLIISALSPQNVYSVTIKSRFPKSDVWSDGIK